jgi:patatin-related protein
MSERDDAERRELRIAPVMTGGTSLAVWIGGVTAELYSVVNREPGDPPTSSTDVYGKLLQLTSTDAIVDVITGTSAGGLNGVLLAAGWALRVPTSVIVGLRELWLELGSIDALLRKPSERNAPSLLRGDEYFWPQLTQVLRRLEDASTIDKRKDPGPNPDPRQVRRTTDLLVTVTTLAGEPTRRIDDLDQQLNETTQAHTLRFDTDDFGNTHLWAERLALASRTSASIPGVFEASYLPIRDVDDPTARDEEGGRPAFASDKASFTKGRWAVDGGVLVNEPLGAALDRVWKRDAGSEVRRVALFVNPTPAAAASLIEDDLKDPPNLMKVVSSSITAPRNIGISGDIDRLREHNRLTRKAVDVRRAIGELTAPPPGLGLDVIDIARSLYPRFRQLRTTDSVQAMLERNAPPSLMEDSSKRRLVEQTLIAASRQDRWLPQGFDEWAPAVPGASPRAGSAAGSSTNPPTNPPGDQSNEGAWLDADWPWGLSSIEYGATVLLELIVRAYRLPVEPEDIPGAEQPFRQLRAKLGVARAKIHELLRAVDAVRAVDNDFWRRALEHEPDDLPAWAARSYEVWPDPDLLTPTPASPGRDDKRLTIVRQLALDATLLASIGTELCRDLERLDTLTVIGNTSATDEMAAIRAVRSIISPARAGRPAEPGHPDAIRDLLQRLVAMHVVAVVFGDTNRRPTLVDLVEVSWSAANALDPDRLPSEKLAGTELGRLGAFIKPSWRANDWMWGRMDGAYQLVLLLLDPVRLRQLNLSAAQVVDTLGLRDEAGHLSTAIEDELAYLDDPKKPVPRSLPACASVMARIVQQQIAKQELPHVYDAVQRSREDGARDGDGGDFRRAYERVAGKGTKGTIPDADVAELVKRCRIGDEGAGDELGQDLLTRVSGRVAIVAANMVTGERAGVPWPAKIGAPLRQIGLAIYAVTYSTTTASKTGIGLSATLFALGGAIVAMRVLGTGINVGLVFLASLILLIGVLIAIMRSGVFSQLPVMLALLVVALALMGDRIAEVITTTPSTAEWKQSLFLDPWSVTTIVIILGSVSFSLSVIRRLWLSVHRYRRERNLARRDDPGAWTGAGAPVALRLPPWPWRTTVEVVLTALVIPGMVILQKPFFRFVLEGQRDGWRLSVIDFSSFLAARHIVVVILGLVLAGIFVGLAWDRGIRLFVGLVTGSLRRAFRVAWRAIT